MSIYQTMNVAGPTNRSAEIQRLAQNAALNVTRRQRLRALLGRATQSGGMPRNGSGLAALGGHASGGGGSSFRTSTSGRAVGLRGGIQSGLTQSQLAAMMAGSAAHALTPGVGAASDGANPGGFDFGAIPDPTDPAQSPASIGPVQAHDPNAAVPTPPIPGTDPAQQASAAALGIQAQPNMNLNQLNAALTAAGQPAQSYPTTITPNAPTPTVTSGGTGLTNSQLPPAQQIAGIAPNAPVISSSMTPYNAPASAIPLGGGLYYDPAQDAVVSNARRPGAQI